MTEEEKDVLADIVIALNHLLTVIRLRDKKSHGNERAEVEQAKIIPFKRKIMGV